MPIASSLSVRKVVFFKHVNGFLILLLTCDNKAFGTAFVSTKYHAGGITLLLQQSLGIHLEFFTFQLTPPFSEVTCLYLNICCVNVQMKTHDLSSLLLLTLVKE